MVNLKSSSILDSNNIQELEHLITLNQDKRQTRRLQLKLQFLKHGLEATLEHHGLLVEGKYLFSIKKKKYRIKGTSNWYWYTTIEELIKELRSR